MGAVSAAAVLAVLGLWIAAVVVAAVALALTVGQLRRVFRKASASVDRAFDVLAPQERQLTSIR